MYVHVAVYATQCHYPRFLSVYWIAVSASHLGWMTNGRQSAVTMGNVGLGGVYWTGIYFSGQWLACSCLACRVLAWATQSYSAGMLRCSASGDVSMAWECHGSVEGGPAQLCAAAAAGVCQGRLLWGTSNCHGRQQHPSDYRKSVFSGRHSTSVGLSAPLHIRFGCNGPALNAHTRVGCGVLNSSYGGL